MLGRNDKINMSPQPKRRGQKTYKTKTDKRILESISMNSKKLKSKYLKCSILIISLCIILGAISACLPFSISLPDMLDENGIDKSAMTITTNASDGLGEFNDGYNYVYTDKDLIDRYRAGDASTPYDMTIQKVAKTTSNRGTKENPYVIATVAD